MERPLGSTGAHRRDLRLPWLGAREVDPREVAHAQPTMNERQRRLWAGSEAHAIGWGGVAMVARATGIAISTVRQGRDEARAGAKPTDAVDVRRKGAGQRPYEDQHPETWPLTEGIAALLAGHNAATNYPTRRCYALADYWLVGRNRASPKVAECS